MRLLRCVVPALLLLTCFWCFGQQPTPAKGTSKSQAFMQSPEQVYAAALQLVESSPMYQLVGKEDRIRSIRFRLARRGSPGAGQYLSSGLFTVQDQPIAGKTHTMLTISIMNDPGTSPRLGHLSAIEGTEIRQFYKALKKRLQP